MAEITEVFWRLVFGLLVQFYLQRTLRRVITLVAGVQLVGVPVAHVGTQTRFLA